MLQRDLRMTVSGTRLHITTSSSYCICIEKVFCHWAVLGTAL